MDFLTSGPDIITINGAIAGGDGTEAVNGTLNRGAQTLSLGDFSGSVNADGTTDLIIAASDTATCARTLTGQTPASSAR